MTANNGKQLGYSLATLTVGALHGRNGWFALRNGSARGVPYQERGNVLHIEPAPGATIVMGKDTPDQSSRHRHLELEAMVDDATETSLIKIEVRTNPVGWDKKFQIYFGSSMQVNYGPRGEAVVIVPATVSGHWYHIRLDLDLDKEALDVWVDGVLVTRAIPMHPGPITDIGMSV